MLSGDFLSAIQGLDKNAFVYFDPPYDPLTSGSSFTGYTELGFDEKDQIRLKNECDKLDSTGVKFLVSNSDTPFIRELYKKYNFKTVESRRVLNCNGELRGKVNEVLIFNYSPKD